MTRERHGWQLPLPTQRMPGCAIPVTWGSTYQRLVDAVTELRAHRAGVMVGHVLHDAPEEPVQAEELLDALADNAPAAAIGDLLAGPAAAVLARLRGESVANDRS